MQGLGNCMTRTLKPATEESLETSRAISRFFERFYCPTVMLVRDRTLEKRAEGGTTSSSVFCKGVIDEPETKPSNEVNVLSSDLDSIRLKDECMDCGRVSSTIKIQDDPSDQASAPCVPCAEKLRKLEEKPQLEMYEVLGETEVESYDILRQPEADLQEYQLAKELEVEDFITSEDVSGETEERSYIGSTEPEVYVIPEQDSKDAGKGISRDQRTRFNGGKSRTIKESVSVDAKTEESLLVDLTNDEPRSTWKQTILKRYCGEEDSRNSSSPETVDPDGLDSGNDSREARIMIADSSSKSQRENSSTSLATALRDRGPCVIPVQPNHSLPLRPVPPAPMRSSLILKPAVLKLSKPPEMERPDADSSRSSSSTSTTTTTMTTTAAASLLTFANEDSRTFHFGEPARLENFVTIAFRAAEGQPENHANDATTDGSGPCAKRKVGEEAEKSGQKESKKRRKSHEADSSQSRVDGESSKNSPADKNAKTSQPGGQETWNDVNYGAAPPVVSTTDDNLGRDKESAKTVPPLRLKKIVCEGSSEGNRTDEISAMSRTETNYRIVTGATPQPPASVPTSTILFWTTTTDVISKQGTYKLPTFRLIPQDHAVRRSPTKNDGYKLKYRRNRLKQKLRELKTKRIDLDQQMASVQETNPLQSTRLKQMMNCNEKQMENLSKLLKKLCDTTADEKIVNIEEGDAGNPENPGEKENTRENVESLSPEPPKLSPSSPLDYAGVKSPGQLRDSPPVLPRVCLTIPPNLGNDLAENLHLATPASKGNAWSSPDRSPSHLSIVLDASDEENPGPSVDDTLTGTAPVASSSGQGLSMPIIDTEGSEPVNTNEVIIVNRPEENTETGTFPSPANRKINSGNPEAVTPASDDIFELFGFTLPDVQGNARFAEESSDASNLVSNELEGERAEGNNAAEIYAQIVPTVSVQQQVSAAGNALQNQANHYEPAVTQENNLATGFVEHYQNAHTVTSSSNQPVTIESSSTIFSFDQTNFASDICQQRSIPAKKANEETIESESLSRNDESRIMSEQFPTLGNWVKSRAKNTVRRHVPKVKSKKTPDVLIATAAEDTTRISDTSKIASSSANIPVRNIPVNAITPQWNAERWQHYQQRQQRPQQQLLQQIPPKTGQSLPPRPGICPPISVTQFYPTNYAIELYENPAFRYHSAICPYNNCQCRLHPGISIGGYHPSVHDTSTAALRPAQHVDKRLSPLVSQEPMRQHYTAEMLKYHTALPAGGYHPNGVDYERCRIPSNVRNGATVGCLPPLLLPPPPPPPPALAASSQQSLPRSSLGGLASHNVQYGRNRMIPDVVAAAAAAAVVAAASLGQQNNPLPPCSRSDRDANAGGVITDFISGETAARLCKANGNCDRLAASNQANGTEDSRHNGANVYQKFRNLESHGNRVNVDGSYATSSTFVNNVSTTVADVCQMTNLPAPRMQDAPRNEPMRNQTVVYETPNLEKVGRSPNVTSTLQCSSCGLPGSLFKCLGCETAFYCNERCQERHWIVHGEKCPKKMPKLKKVA